MLVKKNHLESSTLESQKCLEKLIETTTDGIWDWDLQTNTVYYSDRWKAMLGYNPDEISTEYTEWSNRVHPDDLALALKTYQEYRQY